MSKASVSAPPQVAKPAWPSWPVFPEDERQAVMDVLVSGRVNYWTGNEAREFEREYAEYLGVPHAIALHNGTLALELALQAFGIDSGEVITTSRTFIASASAAVMRGCVPVIADVDRDSQNVTAETIRPLINERTRAIIPVHLAGWPCDMDSIMALAEEHGLIVIEDCAQAHGAFYKGRPVGSIGHAGAFSFCQDKIMTTGGEGGLLALKDEEVWKRAWAFKDHGKSYDAVYNREHPPGFRWLHESFGTNWRMLEVQAAIGRLQLRKLPEWIRQRQAHAAVLNRRLAEFPSIRLTLPPQDVQHAYYKYYVFVEQPALKGGWDRDRIMTEIAAQGVPAFSGSCSEIYLEKAFTDAGYGPQERLPVAQELGETSLMFLVHPTLSEADMEAMADVICSVVKEATR
ncbi:DegT/DnrJ/EryC1/StrS family aminotransferase [Deinococcus radiophilus]|uniref:DegT/DnrJ/EryC1/StrS aminotransferase family protein n=1 Tax=Deinococcus radiophilus TaxID=32062 RepID=A0A3S0INI1_9DEIO|nr:DegT/DnrJ/EryC1/StrS aminotransferase family protein [Deinococcus radiophilus]RTR28025.1 DegT/DnrJ/EryC1/StrS aminotransferase family protein [Deinococcus radiophilus]UFA51523.1 DegT/DnrJ/EryC1/StrS aminotransferase family protein [Deinococcus radiophilus]